MRVYRVERRSCADTGPFEWGAIMGLGINYNSDDYPTPGEEGIRLNNRHCGCADLDQLRHWFGHPPILAALEEDDFIVSELDVPDPFVERGSRQVVFPRSMATVVTYHRPAHILSDQLPLPLAA